jgi:hypothetical protein
MPRPDRIVTSEGLSWIDLAAQWLAAYIILASGFLATLWRKYQGVVTFETTIIRPHLIWPFIFSIIFLLLRSKWRVKGKPIWIIVSLVLMLIGYSLRFVEGGFATKDIAGQMLPIFGAGYIALAILGLDGFGAQNEKSKK